MAPKLLPCPDVRRRIAAQAKRMTLLATFPCKDLRGNRAFVICADAQETQDDYRFFLEKLAPHKTGNFEILIGGAGDADLVEAFELRLCDTLAGSSAQSIRELEKIIKTEFLDYTKNEIGPFLKKRKSEVRFVIGAHALATKECDCWVTKASRLKPLREVHLLGIDHVIYKHLAARLYSEGMPLSQAFRACLYLLSIAKKTSNAVDGPSSLGILANYGLKMEDPDYISEVEDHLSELTTAADGLFVALPDLGMSAVEFEATLQEFLREVWAIRKKYVTIAGLRIAVDVMRGANKGYSPFVFPQGAGISIDPTVEGEGIVVNDDPYQGLWVGSFRNGNMLNQERSASRLRLCGKRREFGGQVFVEVVPCKLPLASHHNQNESCISGTWLETLSASDTEDVPDRTQ
jgi:hypothetical protein